jgi:biotin carboxyl carrier protein
MEKKDNLKTLNINSTLYITRLSKKFLERKPFQPEQPGLIYSFIPGTIIDILVKEGQHVQKGADLLILDAMKMQNRLKSPVEGLIKRIHMKKGDRVPKGVLLVEIE